MPNSNESNSNNVTLSQSGPAINLFLETIPIEEMEGEMSEVVDHFRHGIIPRSAAVSYFSTRQHSFILDWIEFNRTMGVELKGWENI